MFCPNTSNPQVKADFDLLSDFIGNKFAGLVFHRNKGNLLDKTPNGEDSLLFQGLVRLTGSIQAASKVKAQLYMSDYLAKNNWLETGIEPMDILDDFASNAGVLAEYKANNLETKYALERLPDAASAFVTITKNKNKKQSFTVKNKHIKPATGVSGGVKFWMPEIDTNVKKYITGKYFRLDPNKQAYYPFSLGNSKSNIQHVKLINSEFREGQEVVRYNSTNDTIEFGKDILYAQYTTDSNAYDENLSDIQSLETTVSDKLDADKEIISRYKGLIDVINKSLSEKTGRRDTLLARRDRLQDKIDQLEADGTNKIIIQQAKEDIESITARLTDIDANLYKELNEDQLWDILADLQELGAYIRGWDGLPKLLDVWNISLKEISDEITGVSGTLGKLHVKYLDLIKISMVKYANKVSYRADFSEKLFDALEDEGMVSRMVFGASMSNSELVKIVDDIIQKAAYKINEETLNKDKELTDWLTKIQKHLGIKDEVKISERFHQLDKNGKWTGGIVSKIKQDYFDTVSDLSEKANITGNWAPFFKFLADNTYEMLESEFKSYLAQKEAKTGFNIGKISSQKNSKGEYVFQEKDFIKQEELIAKYESHREAYKKDTLSTGNFLDANGEFLTEDHENTFLAIMDDWDMKNNPWYKTKGRNRNPFAHYRVRDRIDSRWFDAKFAAIEKDPVLKEFYDFYRERMKDNDASLPYHKKEQSNLIYSVRKTMAEEMVGHRGFAKATALMKDKAMGLVMAESQSDLEGRAIVGDKIYKNIPVGMLYTSLTGEERSPNIFKALKKHTDVATNYKFKVKVEPIANAAQDIIDNMSAVRGVTTEEGKTLKKSKHTGQAHQQKAALFNTRARLQYLVDATLHGESQSAPDLHGEGFKSSTGETVKFSGSKLIDSLIKLKYLQALSVPNIISPTVNLAVGAVNNYSYAAGGIDFDSMSLTKAYPKMISAISRNMGTAFHIKDFEQVVTWLVRLDILPDINSAAFEDSATWDKWLTILQSKGEYINQGATMVAYLMYNKVKDKNGKDVSLLDAYKTENGKLVWNTELMGEQTNPDSNEIISKDGRGVNLFRLSQKIKGINEYIHGDYNSKQEIKKTATGRAIALFKTWIFATTEHRFGAQRYESRLQRDVKGRYRSYFSATTQDGIELSIKKILPLLLKAIVSGKAFDVLSDLDKVNLKRNLRELQILGAITLLTMMAMGAGDDEDDPVKMRALNILINLASKTQSDLEFYLNPASMSSIANNAIPIIGTMTDMVKIGTTFYGTILGDGIYKTGPFKGQSKFVVAVGRTFPVTNGAVKMWNYSAQQFNFGATR